MPHRNPALLFTPHAAYTVQGTLVRTKHGRIVYARALQRTLLGTEAQYLLMRHIFEDLKYRRYEWKCDHLHTGSQQAALRYGFQFEGIFRQAIVYKGRSRDTAWYAMLDSEWPFIRQGFEQWLDPSNFDKTGKQRTSLSQCIEGSRPRSRGNGR